MILFYVYLILGIFVVVRVMVYIMVFQVLKYILVKIEFNRLLVDFKVILKDIFDINMDKSI